MRVLFVFFARPATPFSTSVAALAAVVRRCGHVPEAIGFSLDATIEEAARRVEARDADVVAVSAMSRDWPGARALLERLRPGPFRVVGGYHASLAPEDVARSAAVDAICIGEGERPLAALLAALERGAPRGPLPGLWLRGPSGAFEGPPPAADPEPDIAALPRWDYEALGEVPAMLDRGINTFGATLDRFLPVRASRGCPYACAYCSAPTWERVAGFGRGASGAGRRLRVASHDVASHSVASHSVASDDVPFRNTRPVDHLCDELADLRDAYAPEGFELWDEHFPVDLAWLDELAERYPRRVGLPFKVEMHPNAASRARLERLAAAGCVLFHCGVEAGDAELRRRTLNRRCSEETLQRVFDDCRALGIATSASVMTALPGETYAMAHATVELLERLRPDSFMWSTYMPLPFTPLGDAAMAGGWPGPARERLGDRSFRSRTPPAMSPDERARIHEELAALQRATVRAAAGPGERARPVATPTDRMPSELAAGVGGAGDATDALATRLGLGRRGAPLGQTPRVEGARWDGSQLQLTLRSAAFPPHRVFVGERGAGPAFVTSAHLRLSHAGAEAPRALRDALETLAERLGEARLDELCALLEGASV